MTVIFLKDLREIMAAPWNLVAMLVWAGLVIIVTSVLPLPESELVFAVADLSHSDEELPFPSTATLKHSVDDIPGVKRLDFHKRPNDVFLAMSKQDIDAALVWHPILLDEDLEWHGEEEGVGTWIAYSRPKSEATAARIGLVVRQAQMTALNIDNARGNGRNPILPTIGSGDLVSELAPKIENYVKERRDKARTENENREGQLRLQDVIRNYESQFNKPLEADKLAKVVASYSYFTSGSGVNKLEGKLREKDSIGHVELWSEFLIESQHSNVVPLFSEDEIAFFATSTDRQEHTYVTRSSESSFKQTPFLIMQSDAPARPNSAYLIPGMITLIATAIAFMLTAAATVREREHSTEHLLIAGGSIAWLKAYVGKVFAPSVVAFVTILILLLMSQGLLGFQIKFGAISALSLVAIMIMAAAFQGLAVGSLLNNQSTALSVSGIYLISLLLFGGVFIPMENASPFIRWIYMFLPTGLVERVWSDWMTWGISLKPADYLGPLALLALSMILGIAGIVNRRRFV